jgi:hypothetical protein
MYGKFIMTASMDSDFNIKENKEVLLPMKN